MDGSFGELLRGHRVSVELTQEALAERAALSGQAVGALERGDRRFPRRDTVTRLADALGLTGEARAAFVAAASRRGRPRTSTPVAGRDDACGRAWHRALPCDVADFTGRTGELEMCEQWVSTPATNAAPVIVLITGMAGCGKSALAVHVAHRFADRFPDGQFFLDLRGHAPGHEPLSAQVAVAELLRCLGIPGVEVPAGLAQRAALWRSELADRRTLIVLDNALDAGQLLPLLPGSPGHLVLVTSRHRLPDLDGAVDLPLEPMPAPDAAGLFVRVAQRSESDPDAVAEVVELCGRLPLAIRLAATRLRHRRTWTVAGLTERLRDQQQRLGELSAGSRSVAGAFELSYRQLTAQQQRVFRLLGLHPGADIDPYGTAALCGTGVVDARRGLEQLADVHLLREHAPDRYTFHDLLRDYASAAAYQEPEAERRAALRRLVDYYLCAAAGANRVADPFRRPDPVTVDRPAADLPSFSSPHDVLGWWEAERANLLRAIDAAVLTGRDVQAWQLAQALVPFFSQTGNAQDRHDTQRIALGSARRVGDPVAEANILVDLGSACHRLGQLSEARTHLETAASLAGRVGDARAQARALNRLAIADQAGGDYARAERHLTTALALFRSIGDHRHEGGTLASLATLYEHAGRYTDSLRTFAEALSIMDRLGPLVYSGRVHEGLAWLYLRLGRHDEGCAQFDHALGLAREVSDREGTVRALLGLGYGHLSSGRLDDALTFLRRVLETADRGVWIGNMRARALRGIALVHSRRGRYSEAANLQEEALLIARNYSRRILQVTILNDLADTHAAAGRHADAAGCYRRAGALALEIDGQAGQHPAESRLGQEQARAHDGLARLP